MTTAAESREQWVRQGWCSNEVNDVEVVQESINAVYARFNRPAPQIIWCDNPWQLATVPFLMNLVCLVPPEFQNQSNGREFLQAVREQLAYLDHPIWQESAQCVKNHLSSEIEQRVQNGRRALYESSYERVSDAIDKRLDKLKTIEGNNSDFAIPERQRATFQTLFQAATGIDIKRLGGVTKVAATSLPEIEGEQSVADQLIAESAGVFVWDLGKFAHPWAKTLMGSQLQEQLREPFRDYVGHIISLESCLATERGGKWQQPPELNPPPFKRDPRCIYPARSRGMRGLPPKLIEPVLASERFGLAQESAALLSKFGGMETMNADNHSCPGQRLFSSDYELLWGSWATEVLEILLDVEEKREKQKNENESQSAVTDDDLQEIRDYWNLCKGAFMYILEAEIVYACKNPTILVDEQGRLHSQDRAAISFPDGYGFHFTHGMLAQETN